MPVMELTQTQLTKPNKLTHNINEITTGNRDGSSKFLFYSKQDRFYQQ